MACVNCPSVEAPDAADSRSVAEMFCRFHLCLRLTLHAEASPGCCIQPPLCDWLAAFLTEPVATAAYIIECSTDFLAHTGIAVDLFYADVAIDVSPNRVDRICFASDLEILGRVPERFCQLGFENRFAAFRGAIHRCDFMMSHHFTP